MDKKVLLMILDGWGIGNGTKSDVISTMHPAYISAMTEKYPHAQLRTVECLLCLQITLHLIFP